METGAFYFFARMSPCELIYQWVSEPELSLFMARTYTLQYCIGNRFCRSSCCYGKAADSISQLGWTSGRKTQQQQASWLRIVHIQITNPTLSFSFLVKTTNNKQNFLSKYDLSLFYPFSQGLSCYQVELNNKL
jgi:hypothetical protein